MVPDIPDFSGAFDSSIFSSWTFGGSATRVADMLRGLISAMPSALGVFITLAFTFFIFGLLFRLLKELF